MLLSKHLFNSTSSTEKDIDLSPTFTIFLSTRDPTVEFPPDICSRVTFVNFTVTRSSLQTQCLNQVSGGQGVGKLGDYRNDGSNGLLNALISRFD